MPNSNPNAVAAQSNKITTPQNLDQYLQQGTQNSLADYRNNFNNYFNQNMPSTSIPQNAIQSKVASQQGTVGDIRQNQDLNAINPYSQQQNMYQQVSKGNLQNLMSNYQNQKQQQLNEQMANNQLATGLLGTGISIAGGA